MSLRHALLLLFAGPATFLFAGGVAFLLLSTFGTAMLPGGQDNDRAVIHYALVFGLCATPIALIALNKRLRKPLSKDRT